MSERRPYNLEIIAGPCSVDPLNLSEAYDIANVSTEQGPAVYGTRVVGLKSRTALDAHGSGMGMDYDALMSGNSEEIPPSVLHAQEIVKNTGMLVATEVMMPERQMRFYEGRIPEGKLLAWNPSVDQLGWHTLQTAEYAAKNGWNVGIKNGKALGVSLEEANNPNSAVVSSAESAWVGLASYTQPLPSKEQLVLIQRGVDVPDKGMYRNAPIHEVAKKVKRKVEGSKMYFDPSHSIGPNLRDHILEATVHAMHMKDGDDYLYDGILIEAGTSSTDTGQHITISELDNLARELAQFRQLRAPESGRKLHLFGDLKQGELVTIG